MPLRISRVKVEERIGAVQVQIPSTWQVHESQLDGIKND